MVNENQAKRDIERLAEQSACDLLTAFPTLKAADQMEKRRRIMNAMLLPQTSAARLMAVLRNDSSFGDLRGGWIQCGNIGRRMQDHVVPLLLIESIIDGHSAKSFVDEALAFADCRRSTAETYTPLAGATVEKAVSLGDGIDLVPWADVPDSFQKTSFDSDSSNHELASSWQITPQMPATGNSAIRIRVEDCQILFSSREDDKAEIEALSGNFSAKFVKKEDVVRCIIAQSERPVAVLGYWTQFDKKIAHEFGKASHSYDEARSDKKVHTMSAGPMVLDGESIAGLFHRFVELNSSEKKVMRISLDRLSQALWGGALVDKAIDLGIALEVMLLHGIDENNRGELKYRSSIRGAAFLGGNNQERLKTFKNLKNAYDLRSKAVHSGDLPQKYKGEPSHETLNRATSICAHIARELIDKGSFPNWEDEYVVGGQCRDPDL